MDDQPSRSPSTDSWVVRCPCCKAQLEVDSRTGAVLSSHTAKKPKKDFDALLRGIDEDRLRAEQIFDQEQAALVDRERLLEERFEKALEEARQEPAERPERPFDFE